MDAAPLHIIDELIEERAPRLRASPIWPVVRPSLYALLGYTKAREMADEVITRSGADALEYVSALLSLKVWVSNIERIPRSGRMVVVCNHPTGIADGIAMYDAIKSVRSDAIFFANADALRVSLRMGEVIIPVEWVEAKRTREKTRDTLLRAKAAFEEERCVVVFPAGRLATQGADGKLNDPPWQPSAVSLARKYNAPVVPMHMTGPSSLLFHLFHRFSQELRDITLFHEMLNKEGKLFRITVGKPISPEILDADAVAGTTALKAFVEQRLARDADAVFQ